MRGKIFGCLAALALLVGGCKQRVFLHECDWKHYGDIMPTNLENSPSATCAPTIHAVSAPPTIYNPEREARFISLAECISIALEQGTTGNQNPNFSSVFTASDNLVQFGGRAVAPNDQIRVLALDPAIIGAGMEQSLSKFDAVWSSSVSWQNTDRPIGTPLDSFQSGDTTGQSNINAIEQMDSSVSTGVFKPLPTGGVAGITFRTDYQYTNLPARVNPSYRPTLQFQFEQPLLAGYGVEINQIRAAHPGSVLTPGVLNTQPTAEGILITRIRFDQQRGEFQRNLHFMLNNVETAYWALYSGYWTLYAREAAMRQAYEAWKISLAKYQAGRVSIADLAQTRGQYELFRDQRITALNALLEAERQLRALMGMHIEDGTRLVPSDEPTLAPFNPDWETSLQEALSLRPELFLARQEVKANQLTIIAAKNQMLPDLRFTATYDVNAIGSHLDGPGADNAFRQLSSDHFNNWGLGLRLNVPIGFRNAAAQLRIARLTLARSYALLQDNELKAERYLGQQYRLLFTNYEQIRARRAQREAFGEQLRARFQEFLAGRGTLDLLLEAQRFWADALANEYLAIGQYNQAIATFHFAKGTILQHDNVVISEGPLPGCALARAVEHQAERTKALVLRERATPVHHEPFESNGSPGVVPALPQLPNGDAKAPSLPALLEKKPALPPAPVMPTAANAPKAAPQAPGATIEASALKGQLPGSAETVKVKSKSNPNRPSEFGALRPVSATVEVQPPKGNQAASLEPLNGTTVPVLPPPPAVNSSVPPLVPRSQAPMPTDQRAGTGIPLPPLSGR